MRRRRLPLIRVWLYNPIRVDAEARMPRFEDDDGKTGVLNVFGGDAREQYDAIWQFILQGESMQPPAE